MTKIGNGLAADLTLAARLALHAGSFYVCRFAFSALPLVDQITGLDITNMTGAHYQFLTICSLQLTEAVMCIALAADVLPDFTALADLKGFCMSMALPMEILVSLLYWSLQMLDPDLVAPPREIEDPLNPGKTILKSIIMPRLPDLAMHAAPPVLLILDYLLFSRRLSASLTPAKMAVFATTAYIVWVEYCASKNGMYPYPILSLVPTWARFAIYAVSAVINFGGRHLSDALHRAVWGEQTPYALVIREEAIAARAKLLRSQS